MPTLWTRDGFILRDSSGLPLLCEECRCEECEEAIDKQEAVLLAMMQEDQHVWAVVVRYPNTYTCPEWTQDPETGEWSETTPASGALFAAMQRGEIPQFDKTYLLTQARVYQNQLDGSFLTLGCRCNFDMDTHSCVHEFLMLSGYEIGGSLAVRSDTQAACEVNQCDLLKLCLTHARSWYGGELTGEGYLEDLSDGYSYTPCLDAYLYTVSETDPASGATIEAEYVATIDCECTAINVVRLNEMQSFHPCVGICDSPCDLVFVLRQTALQNGWEWHDDGLFFPMRYSRNGSAYDFAASTPDMLGSATRFLCGALNGNEFYYINCQCKRTTLYIDTINGRVDGASPSNIPEDFWHILDWNGACACVDYRKLVLEYPEIFNIIEYKWGSHAIYSYDEEMYGSLTHYLSIVSRTAERGTCSPVEQECGFIDYEWLNVICEDESSRSLYVVYASSRAYTYIAELKTTVEGDSLVFGSICADGAYREYAQILPPANEWGGVNIQHQIVGFHYSAYAMDDIISVSTYYSWQGYGSMNYLPFRCPTQGGSYECIFNISFIPTSHGLLYTSTDGTISPISSITIPCVTRIQESCDAEVSTVTYELPWPYDKDLVIEEENIGWRLCENDDGEWTADTYEE